MIYKSNAQNLQIHLPNEKQNVVYVNNKYDKYAIQKLWLDDVLPTKQCI